MFSKITFLLHLAILVGVNAQDPTSTSGISSCILQCVSQGLTGTSCQSITDFACVYTDQTFQQQTLACLQANCTGADVASVTQLQRRQCASDSTVFSTASNSRSATSPSRSGSRTTTTRPGPSTSGSGTSSRLSATSTSTGSTSATSANASNSAMPVMLTAGPGATIASIVGFVGFIVGGGLVL